MTYEEWENYEEMETVVPETPYKQSRWSTYYTKVVKSPDGKFYELDWESGSTEYQDMPWEDTFHQVIEVEPYEVTVTKYRKIQ